MALHRMIVPTTHLMPALSKALGNSLGPQRLQMDEAERFHIEFGNADNLHTLSAIERKTERERERERERDKEGGCGAGNSTSLVDYDEECQMLWHSVEKSP